MSQVRVYLDVDKQLKSDLESVDRKYVIRALEEVVDEHAPNDGDELGQYDSVRDIRDDDSIPPAERKRREIRAKRRSDITRSPR